MKKNLDFLVVTIFAISLLNCKKSETNAYTSSNNGNPQPVQTVPHTITGKVLEYGTDLPVKEASVTVYNKMSISDVSDVYGCGGDPISLITDSNGKFSFESDSWGCPGVSKNGYWESDGSLTNVYADSAVIRLIPQTSILIHIKNLPVNGVGFPAKFFTVGMWGKIADSTTIPFNQFAVYPGGFLVLYPDIDTTVRRIVYGNTFNIFEILQPDVEDPMSNSLNPFLVKYQYIPNDSNYILNISYDIWP